jgi:hypothetical protein
MTRPDEIKITIPPTESNAPVEAGLTEAKIAEQGIEIPPHDCDAHAVPYVSDGALGHGWECGLCGAFLQAG